MFSFVTSVLKGDSAHRPSLLRLVPFLICSGDLLFLFFLQVRALCVSPPPRLLLLALLAPALPRPELRTL